MKPQSPRRFHLIPAICLAVLVATALAPASLWAAQAPVAPETGVTASSATDADQLRQCLSDLKAANVEFLDLGTITKEGCTVEGAIELDAVSSPFGKVLLPGKPTIACLFAQQFITWVSNRVQSRPPFASNNDPPGGMNLRGQGSRQSG